MPVSEQAAKAFREGQLWALEAMSPGHSSGFVHHVREALEAGALRSVLWLYKTCPEQREQILGCAGNASRQGNQEAGMLLMYIDFAASREMDPAYDPASAECAVKAWARLLKTQAIGADCGPAPRTPGSPSIS